MADLDRIKRNVAKMAGMNAPEADIDAYIGEEGVSVEQVRAHRPGSQQAAPLSSFREAQRQSATADRGALAASTVGGAQGATLSFGDEIMAGAFTPLEMAIGAFSGEDAGKGFGERMGDAYGRGLDLQRAQLDTARQNHPTATMVGEIGGGVAAMAPGLGTATSLPGRIAVGAAEGLGYGGVSGFGSGEGFEDRMGRAEYGAQLGAGIGAAIPGTGVVANAVGRSGRAALAPFTAGGRQRLASDGLLKSATDPDAVRATLNNFPAPMVPGSQPTTGQMTGDMGLLGAERAAATRNPEMFGQIRANQNQARVEAMRAIEPGGAPEKVAATVRQRLDAIEAETDQLLATATEQARQRAGAIGAPVAPEVAGGAMRNALDEARNAAKTQERALWSAVDPDGTLALSASNAKRQAMETVKGLPASAKPPSGEEAAILSTLGQYPDGAVPFSEITAMSSRIKAELRAERMANGESPAYRRLSQMNAALMSDLDTAIAGKVAQEAEAVAAGRMSPEQTAVARLQREQQEWYEQRSQGQAMGQSTGTGARADAAFGPRGVPSAPGAQVSSGGGFRDAAGASRVPEAGDGPNFDAEALGRLNAANASTRSRAETFDNRLLGPIRQRPGSTAPYTMPAGAVPAQIFNATPRSPEAIGRMRAAIGDQATTEALQGYAVGEVLRVAGRPDGTIDPARLTAWRRTHANAIREVPGLDGKLADAARASETIAEVTTARQAASAAAQKGALGRLVGVDAPEDVTKIVGGLFSRQDAVAQFVQLRGAIGNDAEAQQGLRRAVLEHLNLRMVGNTEAGTSGLGTIKADGFQNFVRRNRAALDAAGFSGDELRILDDIAADLQQANRSIAAVRIPGQSNTAQDAFAVLQDDTPMTAFVKTMGASGATGLGVGLATSSVTGIMAGSAMAAFAAARRLGLSKVDDIIADALANPERARLLLAPAPKSGPDRRWGELARSYGNSAAATVSRQGETRDERIGAALTGRTLEDDLQMTVEDALFRGQPVPPISSKDAAVARALSAR